jgi:hypothetical protein
MRVHPTVTASTMIAQIRWWAQGQMSQQGCGKVKGQKTPSTEMSLGHCFTVHDQVIGGSGVVRDSARGYAA